MAEEKAVVERISTGIEGLDYLLCGGIPQRSQVLLVGDVGSGKTLMSFEIAYKNARKGIPVTYLTIEENKKALVSFVVSTFTGFTDANDLIDSKKINIEEKKLQYAIRSPENIQAIVADLIRTAEKNESKLLIIDSFSLLRSLYPDDRSFTRGINYIVESIRNQDVTSIMTFESSEKSLEKAPGLFEESMFDGIIRLSRTISEGEAKYVISVVKMRYSQFKSTLSPLAITPAGIVVKITGEAAKV